MKMDEKIIKFDNTDIKKYKFHKHKISFTIDNIDINIIVASNKVTFGIKDFKCFIGYKDLKKTEFI